MCIMPGAAFDGELRICSHLQINSVPPVNLPLPTPNPRAFRTLSHPSHHRRPYPRRRGRVGGRLLRLGCGNCGVSGAGRPSFVLGVDVSCGAGYICGLSRGSSNASSQRRSMFLATGQAPLHRRTYPTLVHTVLEVLLKFVTMNPEWNTVPAAESRRTSELTRRRINRDPVTCGWIKVCDEEYDRLCRFQSLVHVCLCVFIGLFTLLQLMSTLVCPNLYEGSQ